MVLDKSGSMYGLTDDTIGGFNSMIDKQRAEEDEVVVTTVLFNDKADFVHDRFNIDDVRPIDRSQYVAGGCTALLDAIGTAVQTTMWYCNGDLDDDCCMTFEVPDVSVDYRIRISCTCPFCGALAEPADAEGEAMLQEIINEYPEKRL